MESLNQLKDLIPLESGELGIIQTFVSFLMCVVMSFIVRAFYIRRSFSLTGKNHIGSILPLLSAVVFLVIIVVKSSLALSLGLVGALSIVRFRTPVKEPEELVYLFLAIAVGLGYAAGQIVVTTGLVTLILIMVYFWLSNRSQRNTSEYNLVVSWTAIDVKFEAISTQIEAFSSHLKLIRLDRMQGNNTAVMLLTPQGSSNLDDLVDSLSEIDATVRVSFYEAKTNW